MKRLFVIFLSSIFVFFLSSCSNKNNLMTQKQPIIKLPQNVSISSNDKTIKCTINQTPDKFKEIVIMEPKELEGMNLKFNDQESTLSYKGLTFQSSNSNSPERSFFYSLADALNELEKKDSLSYISSDGNYTFYSGAFKKQKFKIKLKNSSNNVEQILMDDLNIKVDFT